MKIKFTPTAIMQLELVMESPANPTGFIIGNQFGKFKIIETIFPIHFDPSTINDVYAKMYTKFSDKLLGVFFNHSQPFLNDWFIEDIVIHIQYPQPQFYSYHPEKKYILLPQVDLDGK